MPAQFVVGLGDGGVVAGADPANDPEAAADNMTRREVKNFM